VNGLALCSGVGGLELGVRIATRGDFRVVCHVEREAYAAAALVARMEDSAMDRAPVWDDLATFDGRPWRGLLDCITAGIPCQPYSKAGQAKGHEDERALWPELVRIVEECEPARVFIENVPAFLKYFEPVFSCLSGLGYQFAPPLLQTHTLIGGPHLRERLYIAASHPDYTGSQGWAVCPQRCADGIPAGKVRRNGLADADRLRLQSEWRGWVFDCERTTLRHDADGCGAGCGICGSHWDSESPPVRVDHGFPGRVDELRAAGNAVVPDMAAAAWAHLMQHPTSTAERDHV
jgi:DNA (cytosine-5)-methyltransferase 1